MRSAPEQTVLEGGHAFKGTAVVPCTADTSTTGLETSVDLFCGSGAVSAALRRSGFNVLTAVDNDPVACRTYRLNHPEVDLLEADIRSVDPDDVLERHPAAADLGLLVVCAPCQPFSSQNRKRGEDERAALLLETARFTAALAPHCILLENVPGLANSTNISVLSSLGERLRSLGYLLSRPRKIDAATLGVPQRRVRCVMVASRSTEALALFEGTEFPTSRRTVRDAIGDLSELRSGQRDAQDALHYARTHQPIVLERLAAIPRDGGSRSELPPHLALRCHHGRARRSFSDVYGRMRWDAAAPTLTTGCTDVTRGRFAHPEQDRAITLREAALLQTFPRDYVFAGNRRQIATQIGNAVPVAMVEALLPALRDAIRMARTG